MKKLLIIPLLFLAWTSFAQGDLTSVTDTLSSMFTDRLDSIKRSFEIKSDSLNHSYVKTQKKIESMKAYYQSKIDSLEKLKLPAEKNAAKLDSLNREFSQMKRKATVKMDSLKNDFTTKVKSLNLPSHAEERISKFTSSIDKLSLASIDADAIMSQVSPGLPIGDLNEVGLPIDGITSPIESSLDIELPDMHKLSGLANDAEVVSKQLQEGMSVDKIGKAVEDKVSSLDEIKAIQNQALPEGVPDGMPATGDEAKAKLVDLGKKEAVNHFANKEALLQESVDKMNKYKGKYNNVSSIKDLPTKWSNSLRDEPLIERVVPGVTFQFQGFQYFMLDINVSAAFRFTQHITAGLGWNQRLAYSLDSKEFSSSARIYGMRSYGEYHLKRGFALRADVEYMNAIVNQGLANEPSQREWVLSIFAGVKQEYRISKILSGNAQVMYNMIDAHHRSPYIDRLNIRMGFEFLLRKKRGN